MQSAGVNNTSKDAKTGDSSGEEESDDDEAGPNVEVSIVPSHNRFCQTDLQKILIVARFIMG